MPTAIDATLFESLVAGLVDLVADLIPTVLPIAGAILAVTLGFNPLPARRPGAT